MLDQPGAINGPLHFEQTMHKSREERHALIRKAIALGYAGVEPSPEMQQEVDEARRLNTEEDRKSLYAMGSWVKWAEDESQTIPLPADKHGLIQNWIVHAKTLPKTEARYTTTLLREAMGLLEPSNEAALKNTLFRIKLVFDAAGTEKLQSKGIAYGEAQKKKSKIALDARWSGKQILSVVLPGLARRVDELGDPLPAKELWGEFYSQLEMNKLNPRDLSGPKVKDTDRITWRGDKDGIAYGRFKTRISECRTTKKDRKSS